MDLRVRQLETTYSKISIAEMTMHNWISGNTANDRLKYEKIYEVS